MASSMLLTVLVIFSLSRTFTSFQRPSNSKSSKNIYICSDLVSVSEKLAILWAGTRDGVLRKYNLPKFYRYGLDFNINNNYAGLFLCILLCGDVATNPGPQKVIKCITLNARSLKSLHRTSHGTRISNISCFQDLVYEDDADIVCVNETWLDNNIFNSELLSDEYSIYRKDRGSRAGGVLIGVKTSSFKNVEQYLEPSDILQQIEIVSAEITTVHDQRILFSSCYRPPNSSPDWIDVFNSFLDHVCDQFDKIVVSGDFNMTHIPWSNGSDIPITTDPFVETLNDHFLTQVNTSPTRDHNILDLIITSVPEYVKITDVEAPRNAGIYTDHSVIHYEFSAFIGNEKRKGSRFVYDYNKTNFDDLRSHLVYTDLLSCVTHNDVNDDWKSWKTSFLSAVSEHVPCKKIRTQKQLPWINGTILYLIKKKNTVRRKLRSSKSRYLTEKFKSLRATIKRMLRESRRHFYTSLGSSLRENPKRFWSVMKNQSKVSSIPSTISAKVTTKHQTSQNNRIKAKTPQSISSMFNKYFTSVFSEVDPSADPTGFIPATATLYNITLSVAEVESVLANLDTTKATGPDEISARLLKETAPVISTSLCSLYNKSLNQGVFPQEWKIANIVPVYKKGDKEYVENYRPISLLCIVSKVFERCVLNNIREHIYQEIKTSQHGFTRGKSCVTNLLEVLNYIGSVLDTGGQIDTVYLDMSKAFDIVNHKSLLLKLQSIGIGGSLLQWFQSYLASREQRVTVHGFTSTNLPVTSGVPQGSILGPVLFSLYVNDLPDAVTSSHVAMFADDTKLFKEIHTTQDCKLLQNDLDQLQTWSENSGLKFNASKCNSQMITRKLKPTTHVYKLNNNKLIQTDCERDLGVFVDRNLTWNRQVIEQSSKANKQLGYVKRSTIYVGNVEVKRSLYLTLVRPLLGYATQIWTPQSTKLIQHLERVQRRATKYILNLPFSTSVEYTTRLKTLSLLPICYWHELLDMMLFYKITHNLVDIDPSLRPIVRRSSRPTRSSANSRTKFVVPRCRTTTFQRTFMVRSTRMWNHLADELALSPDTSFSSFKTSMHKYYLSALNMCYDVDDPRTYKTVCVKCNSVRSLTVLPSCCS